MLCLRLIVVCLMAGAVFAAEPVTPAVGGDLRESLAATTRERDELQNRIDRLEHQFGLLIAVAGLLAIAAGLLTRAHLQGKRRTGQPPADAVEAVEIGEAEVFPEAPEELVTATTVTMRKRKNATITIRNGSTQREEVTGEVETRRFFSAGEARRPTRRESTTIEPRPDASAPSTTTIRSKTPTRTTALVELSETDAVDGELKPSTDRTPRPVSDTSANQDDSPRRQKTVRVDQQSDRLEVVEVTVKPGTTGIYRRQAFTLLEVMISIALLATVLSSVVASTFTLHRSRQMAQEQDEAQMLGRLFVERMMAEWHWNLNSSQDGSLWKGNYAGDANAVPLTAQMLKDKNIVEELPALNELKVYLECYPQSAMENAINNRTPMALTNRQYGRDRTMVFRIVIDWISIDGNPRRHTQLFARSE